MRSYETRITIHATKEAVWNLLVDLPGYHRWNERTTFVGEPEVGNKLQMRVKLFGKRFAMPTTLVSCDIQGELRWQGGLPGLMVGSHYLRVEESNGGCTVVHGEDFSGLLTPLLSLPLVKRELQSLYIDTNAALKAECEKG